MLALVTGAGGFLGRYIVERLLAQGYRVRALARQAYPEALAGVECVQADIRSAQAVLAACAGAQVVFHTAAVAGIWGPWRHFFEINTLGTQHVIAGCLAQGVAKLVFTSSPSVTFAGGDQCGVDESAPYPRRWLGHYSHTKALAEQQVLAANSPRLATCALRPHLIWGPRDSHLVPRLIERARAGKLVRVGDGKNLVDNVYVENAAEAHVQAANCLAPGSPVSGQAYFISQGEPVNCWQWIDALLALAHLPPVKRQISYRTAWYAGWGLEMAWKAMGRHDEPRMTRFLAAQLARSHYFDISKARRDFGYKPLISQAEGMSRLADELQRTHI